MLFTSVFINHSPPHRWLRNSICQVTNLTIYSPPHRWLRKHIIKTLWLFNYSPPHRWLRNETRQYQ
ncbi:hypothetical protein [uncultured Gammaproteobacteria bacterium]|nr:hypothetical protein [uncultured Gammaproteobacteria bacterium]CAC9642407.1 hypothetical protein [uncultured Gammaproteobacteria bacterium]CAC9643777.1 hypothetical protein [uncultured Gammaproteobacteria bacterium]CAC9984867.1 hypothetical protein [uncultured Gammaproteobacteria bacterium]